MLVGQLNFLRRLRTILDIRWLYWSPTAILLSQYFFVPLHIKGESMQPTLNPNTSSWRDIGIFDRYSIHTLRKYQRGDIVVFRSPESRDILVKRIIGVEGDLVTTLPPYPEPVVRVPVGHAWIEGDEPMHSDDSNRFGPVPFALVDSKLIFLVWPFNRFGFIPDWNRKARVQINPMLQ